MRWERLFDDLEAQLEAAEREDFEAAVADRTRRELALVHIVDRFAAAVGSRLQVTIQGVGSMAGSVARVGDGWVLFEDDAGHDMVVGLAVILAVQGLQVDAISSAERLDSKLGLGHVLRVVARDRTAVVVHLVDGSRLDGTLDRVGADFVDIAMQPAGEPRRGGQATRTRTVGFAGLAVVRSA